MNGLGIAIVIFMILLYVGLIVFMIASVWRLFTKAGKPGWAAIVPIYNTIVMLEVAGKPWWWFFLFLIPIAGLVFAIMMLHGVSKAFGKDAGFTVGLVLLGFIFIPILAWSDAKYTQPVNPVT